MTTTREIAGVHVPLSGVRHNARAVKVVLQRECIRFTHDVGRAVSMLFQALLWLFVIGGGFGSLLPAVPGGVALETVVFPGVLAMTVIVTSMSSASSIVWDREFGFLREMLVAPISRTALVTGKVLAGALLSCAQGVVLLALAGLAGVPYAPLLLLELAALMFLAAFAVSAFGVMLAAGVKQLESYMGVSQLAIMPMVFLSGALFPVGNLPAWLGFLTLVNPLTYTVDPMRQAVFRYVDAPADVEALVNPGVAWFGWTVPVWAEALLVAGAGLAFLGLATARFRRIA
ncbi:ABC-2 type transport system permease protein [Sinosporangium album]|uniref:Transport permease protein n=1 Tax=Sinosporangium album TaxID=504805 RepID=A0A1G8GJ08_9ACTN|nr:ABC transporter permease [Sinosporangium album]SDH94343.1 ABC-2 type transport system permease protein [Sinosporangium album]